MSNNVLLILDIVFSCSLIYLIIQEILVNVLLVVVLDIVFSCYIVCRIIQEILVYVPIGGLVEDDEYNILSYWRMIQRPVSCSEHIGMICIMLSNVIILLCLAEYSNWIILLCLTEYSNWIRISIYLNIFVNICHEIDCIHKYYYYRYNYHYYFRNNLRLNR